MSTMDTIAFFTITTLVFIDSFFKPSYTAPWAYCNDYLSDYTIKFYVFYAGSYQTDSNTSVTAHTGDTDNNDYDEDDTFVCLDDSVSNCHGIVWSWLSQPKQDEDAYGIDGS